MKAILKTQIAGGKQVKVPKIWSRDTKGLCSEYIDEKGNYGEIGQFLYDNLDPNQFPNLMGAKAVDLQLICPTFLGMKKQQRREFLVWLMSNVAFAEFTCGKVKLEKLVHGPNGIAAGDFQTHYGKEDKYSANCQKFASCTKNESALCAAHMLENYVSKTRSLFAEPSTTYWDVLTRDGVPGNPRQASGGKGPTHGSPGFKTCQRIASYPTCGNTPGPKNIDGSPAKVCDFVMAMNNNMGTETRLAQNAKLKKNPEKSIDDEDMQNLIKALEHTPEERLFMNGDDPDAPVEKIEILPPPKTKRPKPPAKPNSIEDLLKEG